MYEETDPYLPPQQEEWQEPPSNILSTSQAINLTCTLASLSALFALFLCFVDQKSNAVRRYSVQSVGFGVIHLGLGMAVWILGALVSGIPFIGFWLCLLFIIAFVGFTLVVLYMRVRMMVHAYRGEAYVLPYIGQRLRKFE